ncbi:MAG: chorismate mutase [Longimicrobiales bacterium]
MSREDAAAEITRLREAVERIDAELIERIAERVRLAREIGRRKHAAGQPTLDPAREAAVVRRAGELARQAELDEEAVREVFWRIIGLSRDAQRH